MLKIVLWKPVKLCDKNAYNGEVVLVRVFCRQNYSNNCDKSLFCGVGKVRAKFIRQI